MLTALDQIANQNHLQLIKAALPYAPQKSQRALSVCIKLAELQNIMQFYAHGGLTSNALGAVSGVQACGCAADDKKEPAAADPLDILMDVRNYCDAGEQEMLDQWIQLLAAMELMKEDGI